MLSGAADAAATLAPLMLVSANLQSVAADAAATLAPPMLVSAKLHWWQMGFRWASTYRWPPPNGCIHPVHAPGAFGSMASMLELSVLTFVHADCWEKRGTQDRSDTWEGEVEPCASGGDFREEIHTTSASDPSLCDCTRWTQCAGTHSRVPAFAAAGQARSTAALPCPPTPAVPVPHYRCTLPLLLLYPDHAIAAPWACYSCTPTLLLLLYPARTSTSAAPCVYSRRFTCCQGQVCHLA